MINNISILKNITILYAEDEKDLREVTHQILKGFTKKQYVAQNGQEGLELFKKYETEMDDIYKSVCNIFEEDHDNAYLFNYRLARIVNQEPRQFLDIEDKDTQETVIQKFEDKINAILESKYYKENEDKLSQNLIIPQKTLELVKSAAGIC